MVQVDFSRLRELTPTAFKLYVYFLSQVETKNTTMFTLSLADLGYQAGLQPPVPYPALAQGRDTQVRNALRELIARGLIEKDSAQGMGRVANTYHVKRVKK
jgi:hypothetical protein